MINNLQEAQNCLLCKKPRCQTNCPINTPIPQVIELYKNGEIEKAGEILFNNNPLSVICAIVCPHERQCRGNCIRGIKKEPVHFHSIEEEISAKYLETTKFEKPESNGIKVAIIGSGPAGLTVAFDLAKRGYDVTIFEKNERIGGVLAYGIPEFRLPKAIVQKEVDNLTKLGVDIETNMVIGRVLSVDEIMERGYKAVFIGSGAGLPSFMGIEGEALIGVYSANEYLTRANLMKAYKPEYDTPVIKSKNVAVVGGGNVAMDAARTALRLGAENVYIVYRRGMEELPARKEEVEHAEEEGIIFKTLHNPVKLIGDENGRVCKMECIQMELGEADASGRRRPIPVEGSNFELDVDTVIMSIGTSPNPLLRTTTEGLEANKWGCLVVNEDTLETTRENVYAGGDAVTGAATVILAMGAGKQAAASIHEKLSK